MTVISEPLCMGNLLCPLLAKVINNEQAQRFAEADAQLGREIIRQIDGVLFSTAMRTAGVMVCLRRAIRSPLDAVASATERRGFNAAMGAGSPLSGVVRAVGDLVIAIESQRQRQNVKGYWDLSVDATSMQRAVEAVNDQFFKPFSGKPKRRISGL